MSNGRERSHDGWASDEHGRVTWARGMGQVGIDPPSMHAWMHAWAHLRRGDQRVAGLKPVSGWVEGGSEGARERGEMEGGREGGIEAMCNQQAESQA